MTTMLRLLAVPLVVTVFLALGGPPCTNVPTLIAAARSHDAGGPCLCALSPDVVQQLNSPSLQAAPTVEPQDGAAAEEGEQNDLVSVQMLVFAVAVAAAALGLLGYLLRRALGLEQMPPPDDGASHH